MADNTNIPSDPPTLRLDRYWNYVAPVYFGFVLVFGLYTMFTMKGVSMAEGASVMRLVSNAAVDRQRGGKHKSSK